jgi:phosphopentomutase
VRRVVLVVLDGAGAGALPDAARYGEAGADTLGHVAAAVPMRLPALRALGLDRVVVLGGPAPGRCDGAWGRMGEASAGMDSVTGHWELAGVVLDTPFPTFPGGFPAEVLAVFEHRIGRATLGNVAASGTAIIERLGAEHLATGHPIVYTSADSVCQIAAHEAVVPLAALYGMCEAAFDVFARGLGVGRVIARPFTGTPGAFTRTAARHDYALPPPAPTLLDHLAAAGVPVLAVGKVHDLFAGRGVTRTWPTLSDADGLARTAAVLEAEPEGLVFVNLVELDTMYGHRNDVAGFAAHLERIDHGLDALRARLGPGDLLAVTADHGNDPTTPGTDHTREFVPVLMAGAAVRAGVSLGTRRTFADLGQTLAAAFGVEPLAHGQSFLEEMRVDHP